MEDLDPDEAMETVPSGMSRILFITPKQPSTNPRMRKAADALAEAGHTVHVLYAWNAQWATLADEDILNDARWTHERIGGDPQEEKWTHLLSRLRRKWASVLGHLEGAYCRSLSEYIRKGCEWKPDIVIGHNPGAIFPTLTIANKLNIPCLFDAEDFYRGETLDTSLQYEVQQLEDRWLDQFSAVTTAAPLISKRYKTLYPRQNFVTINNAFPAKYGAPQVTPVEGPLRVVWFSQVIGTDRGLEPFLSGLHLTPNTPCTLTLIGLCSSELENRLKSQLNSDKHTLTVLPPMEEARLFEFLGTQEIGLALELGETENRRLCRTNKLYTYPLAGCHTLASQTPSQLHFFEQFPELGTSVDLRHPDGVAATLTRLYDERERTINLRKAALAKAHLSLNWETESSALTSLVTDTLTA